MAEIIIKDVRKQFDDFVAVRESSFTVDDGDFFMLLGPSGCGKTTTLRMIAGLELPTSGQIFLDGEEISQRPPSQRDIAFVFQMFALYPHMNVRKNISYPLVSQGMRRADVRKKVSEVAGILGIEDILDQPVGGLSGGDRQRVALGRAIVREPKAFMMDEPLGALDAEFREHMSLELRALHDRMGATTVYVTHDQLELGGVEAAIPEMRESASGKLVLGVRPEHLRLSDSGTLRGEVLATEYLGTTQILTIQTPQGELKARVASDQVVQIGEVTGLDIESHTVTLFERDSGRALRSALNEGVLSRG